jgi:hypothetical protein
MSCVLKLPPQVGVLGGIPPSVLAAAPSGGGILLGTSAPGPYLGTLLKSLQRSQQLAWWKLHSSTCTSGDIHPSMVNISHLAGNYKFQPGTHQTHRQPFKPPNYRVQIHYDNSIITSKLYQMVLKGVHEQATEEYTIKKATWDRRIFNIVHWDAHEKAFCKLPRFQWLTITKLIHKLVNTNRQNSLLYGTMNQCPICNKAEEILYHVFKCQHPELAIHRKEALAALTKSLERAKFASEVIRSIEHGFTQWELQTEGRVRAPTVGSLQGTDVVLVSAFHEQYNMIGWFHLCLGRVSKKWSRAIR